MKQWFRLSLLVSIVIMLCSCSAIAISERAIVKAVFVDFDENRFNASIAIFNCEPTSQIADVKDSASIYTAKGDTLTQAINNAERLQIKQPFYEQNEILIIGVSAIEKFDEIIDFFSQEDAARPGMNVYISRKSSKEFEKCMGLIPKLIRQCENMSQNKNININKKIFELQKQGNSFSAILPVLEIGDTEDQFMGVDKLACIKDNKLLSYLTDNDMLLALMLNKTASKISISEIGIDKISFVADNIRLSYIINRDFMLEITVLGNLRQISTQDNRIINQKRIHELEQAINEYILQRSSSLISLLLQQDIDAFHYKWRFEMSNRAMCTDLFKSNFQISDRVIVIPQMKML